MSSENEKEVLLDHDYDGIRELDNKLPPWWLYLFYITIIWGIGYLIYYHVLGIGDSSHAEYMKEIDPDWTPARVATGFTLGYNSPFSGKEDLTPRRRLEKAMAGEASARSAAGQQLEEGIAVSDLNFDQLILAAMRVSTPADREKLRNAFPEIWIEFESGQNDTPPSAASAPAEAEPETAPLTDDASLAAGQQIFAANCVTCHGQNGEGGIGPNLTDDYFLHGDGMNNIIKVIVNGVPAKGMIAWRGILNEVQIRQVSSYILSLHGTTPPNAKAPQGEKIESIN